MKNLGEMTNDELTRFFNVVGMMLQDVMPADAVGYMLVVVGPNQVGQYMGTIKREDAIKALRELADRMENREYDPRVDFPGEDGQGAGPIQSAPNNSERLEDDEDNEGAREARNQEADRNGGGCDPQD